MKKKVLHVITKSVWGGAQRYIFDLAANLPKDQFEVTVAAGGNGPLFARLNNARIKTVTIPGLQRDINIRKEFLALFSLLYIFIKEKPDIIHLNSSKIGGLGAVAAFIYKLLTLNFKPLTVFTVHGWSFNEKRPAFSKMIIFFLSWVSSLLQDKIILINSADCQTARNFIPTKKLALISNGIEPFPAVPRKHSRLELAQKVGRVIDPEIFLIGAVAELTQNKGLKYLIDAVHTVKNQNPGFKFQTVIVGEGEEREILQKQIRSLNLHNSVFMAGFIPQTARYLKAFDLFILPSLKEGLPYTIQEAMAAGLPVVATSVGGVPDLISQKEAGILIPPRNSDALASAVSILIHDKKMRMRHGRNAKAYIEDKFRLKRMVENTARLYQSD